VSLAGRLGRNSAIYTVASVLQRGLSFLLLPFYTRYLLPDDFGILSVVTVLNGLFTVLFTFSLYGAITRFYFEYRDNPSELREFLGTTMTFGLLASVVMGALTLVVGPWLLGPILGDIPFWPYVALGIVATVFQPFFLMYLHLLQTREQAFRYALLNLLNFLTSLCLVIGLVVFARMRAAGPLLANAIVALVFFCVALLLIYGDVAFRFRRDHLRRALRYCLPLVPHNVAGQLQIMFDRFVLNRMMGTAAVGLYQVAYQFGALLGVVSDAVNRAYVPIAMSALSDRGEQGLAELRELGLTLVAGFCLLAAFISLWAPEGVWFLTAATYHSAAQVVPVFAYSFAAAGIYYVFVNVLFYAKHATPFVMVATIGGSIISIASNLLLVPRLGVAGTAISSLLAQSATAALAAFVGARFETVRWPYLRIVATFLICGALSMIVAAVTTPPSIMGFVLKFPVLLVLYGICNFALWGDVRHLNRHVPALLRRVAAIRDYRGRKR